MSLPNIIILDNFCHKKKCDKYIEWDHDDYGCVSCTEIGQSYNIDRISYSCPYLDEIVEFKRATSVRNKAERKDRHQRAMWQKLKTLCTGDRLQSVNIFTMPNDAKAEVHTSVRGGNTVFTVSVNGNILPPARYSIHHDRLGHKHRYEICIQQYNFTMVLNTYDK